MTAAADTVFQDRWGALGEHVASGGRGVCITHRVVWVHAMVRVLFFLGCFGLTCWVRQGNAYPTAMCGFHVWVHSADTVFHDSWGVVN